MGLSLFEAWFNQGRRGGQGQCWAVPKVNRALPARRIVNGTETKRKPCQLLGISISLVLDICCFSSQQAISSVPAANWPISSSPGNPALIGTSRSGGPSMWAHSWHGPCSVIAFGCTGAWAFMCMCVFRVRARFRLVSMETEGQYQYSNRAPPNKL